MATVVVVTFLLMTAKQRGSTCLNGRHSPSLIAGHSMGFSVVRAVLAEDIRHFDADRCTHQGENYGICSGCALSSGLVT